MTFLPPHTVDTAPEKARAGLEAVERRLGFVPNMMAVLAESPAALEAYQTIQQNFAATSLGAAEQQFVALVVSVTNGCDYCVPVYSGFALKAGVPGDVVNAVRDGTAIGDARLAALRAFTQSMVEQRGRVAEADVAAFLDAGFTKAQVLEVIVGAAFKLISNYTNHIAHIPLDEAFQPMKWEGVRAA